MVESTGTEDTSPDQFIKLKESEVKKKYLEVAFQKGFIKIWNKGDKTFDFVLDSVHEDGDDGPIKVSLSLKNLTFPDCLSVSILSTYQPCFIIELFTSYSLD